MVASLEGEDGASFVIIHDGVSMLQKKKSYSDILMTGTSFNLKNPPTRRIMSPVVSHLTGGSCTWIVV